MDLGIQQGSWGTASFLRAGKCYSKVEGEQAWPAADVPEEMQVLPRPCPSAAHSRWKPAANKSIYSHLGRLVPAWDPSATG